jgi:hypothetical protein
MSDRLDRPDAAVAPKDRLVCTECRAVADATARGWRAYLTDEDELLLYCGACAAREFDP